MLGVDGCDGRPNLPNCYYIAVLLHTLIDIKQHDIMQLSNAKYSGKTCNHGLRLIRSRSSLHSEPSISNGGGDFWRRTEVK